MRTLIILFCFIGLVESACGQSKVVPVSKSELSGISLPAGAKQDNRLLVTSVAKTTLQMVADDNTLTLADNIEVFSLPATAGSESEIRQKLQAQRWEITAVPNQPSYGILKGNGRSLLMYLSASKKETTLYFSEVLPPSTPIVTEQPVTVVEPPPVPVQVPSIKTQEQPKTISSPSVTATTGYKFSTTNFDDGWIATVKEDWVEVVKGNVTVLIHYPNQTTNKYYSDRQEDMQVGWNTLVAPRYSNLQNYFVARNSLTYIEAYFQSGTLTDNQSGRTVYVALFKRGKSPWIEFIAPDINSFGQAVGFNVALLNGEVSSDSWDPLQKMEGYNKFAVAPADLTGSWSSQFGGFQQYVNAYTGADAGMNTHSSAESFDFAANGSYHWQLSVASGYVGNIKFSGAKSDGTLTMPNNWQINFSDIENKPRLYNAYFSCVKGARILWLQDTGYGDYKGFGKK